MIGSAYIATPYLLKIIGEKLEWPGQSESRNS